MKPTAVVDGVALYKIGSGSPLFLMPYPHAGTFSSIAEDPLAQVLLKGGRSLITFDPPGAYNSTADARVDMEEMILCAVKALDFWGIEEPIDLIGHSMGSFCALAFALKHEKRLRSLALIGTTMGWSQQLRHGVHTSWRWWRDREFWLSRFWGTLLLLGRGNLKIYNQLNNIVLQASFVDAEKVTTFPIGKDDHRKPIPIRGKWLHSVRNYDYRDAVHRLEIPVLLGVGRFDPQTPLIMHHELQKRLRKSKLIVFEHSGHYPFIEDEAAFSDALADFFSRDTACADTSREECLCPKECVRHGQCRDCFEHHCARGKLPYCRRVLKTQ